MEAEEPHEPVDVLVFFLCHLDPAPWQVEDNEYSPRDVRDAGQRQCNHAHLRSWSFLRRESSTLT